MIEAETNTSQPGVTQGEGYSPCDSPVAGSIRRKQYRDQCENGGGIFVPMGNHRSGAADIKAVAARQGRQQNQDQNGSQGGRQSLAETQESPDEQVENSVKTTAEERSGVIQPASDAVTDPNGDMADKLAQVKIQIADLLDRIESLQPGFAETTMPKVEAKEKADGSISNSQICDDQALLVSMRELAALLEELVDLLALNAANDADDDTGPAMVPVSPDYAQVPCQPEMQSATDIFMSIYDQLSADTRLEVVEILAAMAFGQQETALGQVTTPNETNLANDSTITDTDDIPTTNNEYLTVDDLRADPEHLPKAGIQGVEVTGMDLFVDPDGMLSEESKLVVNKLIGYLSDLLGGIEVVANVYVDDDGNIGVHLTSGDKDGAVYYPMEGTIYSPHVHTNGSWIPSRLDRENEISGAEDAIVVGDGVAGNETGDYFQYA
jgi:hypothetical protein